MVCLDEVLVLASQRNDDALQALQLDLECGLLLVGELFDAT